MLKGKMSMKYRNEKTPVGMDYGVAKSALQKYIRRGKEEEALKIAGELHAFSEIGKEGRRYEKNFWHRLMIIFMEDIGIGNYGLWSYMIEWMNELLKERESENPNMEKEERILEKMIVNMCRSKKTRSCSFLKSLCELNEKDVEKINEEKEEELEEIKKGEEEGGMKELSEALRKKSALSVIYLQKEFEKGVRNAKYMKMVEGCIEQYYSMEHGKKWKKEILKMKEGNLLYILPLCNYLYGSEELQLVEEGELKGRLPRITEGEEVAMLELPEYVYDKHVGKNRSQTRSSGEYFAKESSKVMPEVIRMPIDLKRIYQWLKCNRAGSLKDYCQCEASSNSKQIPILHVAEELPIKSILHVVEEMPILHVAEEVGLEFPERESEMELISRIQLVCSRNKTDTVYARYKGEVWFVKGPYEGEEKVNEYVRIQEEKREMGLPYIESYMVKMYGDRWKKVPLGIRNRLDLEKKQTYLMCRSLYEEREMEFEMHEGSKYWPETKVLNMEKIKVNVFKLGERELIDYVNSIGYRMKRNIGDMGDRNFIIKEGRVYSVDEEVNKGKVNLLTNLKKRKYAYVKSAYERLSKEGKLHPMCEEALCKEFMHA